MTTLASSPYHLIARRLVERGISAIPVIPGEKRPGEIRAGEWRGMIDWQRFCDRVPKPLELTVWETYPEAGVCAPLGRASNLSALDLDYGSPEVRAAIERIMPPSPVRKAGAKGYTALYQHNDKLASRKWLVDGKPVLELLGHGRQTVIPPTVHPDGMPYRWLTADTLENYPVAELPRLPDDLIERVDAALRPFQTEADRAAEAPQREKFAPDEPIDSYWRELNERGLTTLDSWVPELFPQAKRNSKGHYRVSAYWRQCERPNVGIDPTGIVDWGAGRGMTPIDLVMAASSCDLDTAVKWLKPRVGMPEVEPLVLNVTPQPAGEKPVIALVSAPLPVAPPPPSVPTVFTLDGVMREMYDYMVATAKYPQPVLALGATIATLGTLAGRRYATESGLRTNVYIVGLAESGSGKNHQLECIKQLLAAANLLHFLGGSKIASGAGLIAAVTKQPAILYALDEFGEVIKHMTARNAAQHKAEILSILTEFYSCANSFFLGTDYANPDRPRQTIASPNLCLYGTTAPRKFWTALESSNVDDGSLARFIVLKLAEAYPDEQPLPLEKEVPPSLIAGLQAIAAGGSMGAGNLCGLAPIADSRPLVVQATPEAKALLKALGREKREAMRDAQGTELAPILARVEENAAKCALIRAVASNPAAPVIDEAAAKWAIGFVSHAADDMIGGLKRHVADNEIERSYKRVLNIVEEAGPNGIRKTHLGRRLQWLKPRERNEILASLVETEQLVTEIRVGTGRPVTIYRRGWA
jgi:hypothetical protein